LAITYYRPIHSLYSYEQSKYILIEGFTEAMHTDVYFQWLSVWIVGV